MRITEEIATKCDVLDLIIEEFLAAKNALDGSYRVYEAPFEALNLFNLTIATVSIWQIGRSSLAQSKVSEKL
jgi:hypothetical protein